MAQLIDIARVEVGPRTLTATVRVAEDGPLMTSEDLEGTTRVYNLMPHIIEHVCLGDAGATFRDVMGNTELAHLLEHATVELLAQSNVAGDIPHGRTRAVGDDGRTFEIELACPDDVLVAGALSSACWMLAWAYSGGVGAEPDVEATVEGLVALVGSLPASDLAESDDGVSEQSATADLRLVGDETGDDSASTTHDLSAGAEALESAANSQVSLTSEAPLAESPEARQAASDTPQGSRPAEVPQAEVATVRQPAGDGTVAPMPAVSPAAPSVTGSLPTSQVVR